MAELNVNDITTTTIDPTDKVYGFSAEESKAPTVQTLLGTAPGIMAVGTCATAAATAAKAVTSDNWTGKPGQSILIEFNNANTANNVTLSINQGNAIPVYYLNCASEQISGNAIPAGAVIFTLNAAGNKFYAHLTKTLSTVDTSSKLPIDSEAVPSFSPIDNIIYAEYIDDFDLNYLTASQFAQKHFNSLFNNNTFIAVEMTAIEKDTGKYVSVLYNFKPGVSASYLQKESNGLSATGCNQWGTILVSGATHKLLQKTKILAFVPNGDYVAL